MTLISRHPDLVAEREPGGRLQRALERDHRLRSFMEVHRRNDGNYELSGELWRPFDRVFCKIAQGLYFSLYQRIVSKEQVELSAVADAHYVTAEELALKVRPSPFRDITDEPLPAITPSSWPVREPIFIVDLAPTGAEDTGKSNTRRIFRLVRETPIKWIEYQRGVFSFAFVKNENDQAVCILNAWETLTVAVTTPWPDDRGPLRRGRNNPHSRERSNHRRARQVKPAK